jgi:transcriptional regulator with XRE-family HTH domain
MLKVIPTTQTAKGRKEMAREFRILFGSLLILLLLVGLGTAIAAHAQSPTPPTPDGGRMVPGAGLGGPRQLGQAELNAAAQALGISADDLSAQLASGKTLDEIATAQGVDPKTVMDTIRSARPPRLGPTELDAAAKALGMTSDDLSTQLKGGTSLADIAAQEGVDLQIVQDAIQAARSAESKTQIGDAVTAGTISQDKADWLLEGLSKGFLDRPDGFGLGFRLGGPGPHVDGARQSQPAPSTSP